MQKAKIFAMSSLAQFGYFAILLQAFVIPPPLKQFAPCACTPVLPQYTNKLTLFNQLRSSKAAPFAVSDESAGANFCGGAPTNAQPIYVDSLELNDSLEQLVFAQSDTIKLCVKLDAAGRAVSVETESASLSRSDERLLANYIAKHWTFTAVSRAGRNNPEGAYSMTLGRHQELR
jgi:hypothetical protein